MISLYFIYTAADTGEVYEVPVASSPRVELQPTPNPARSTEVQCVAQANEATGGSIRAAYYNRATSPSPRESREYTRPLLSSLRKRKANNIKNTTGQKATYDNLVEMEVKKLSIECRKLQLQISILQHKEKMQEEKERLELDILMLQSQKERAALHKQQLEIQLLEKQLNLNSTAQVSLPIQPEVYIDYADTKWK